MWICYNNNITVLNNSYQGLFKTVIFLYGRKNVSELVRKNGGTIEYIQLGVDVVLCKVILLGTE